MFVDNNFVGNRKRNRKRHRRSSEIFSDEERRRYAVCQAFCLRDILRRYAVCQAFCLRDILRLCKCLFSFLSYGTT